jgi:signal transduction histidine kinase
MDGPALKGFLDILHEGLLIVDTDHKVIYINRGAHGIFRRDESAFLDKRLGEAIGCLHSEDHGCGKSTWCPCGLLDSIVDVLEGGNPVLGETLSVPLRMGETVEVRNFKVNIQGVPSREAQDAKVCVLLDEVTSLVRRTDELRLCQETVERRSLQCESMTEMILQDVRVPLQRTIETLEASDPSGKAPSPPDAMRIDLATLALSVENLLLMSQMDPQGLPVSKKIVDLPQFVEGVVETLRSAFPPDMVTLNFVPPPGEVPTVAADEKLLRLILENLIRNAVSQSPEDGRIRLEVAAQNRNHVIVSVLHTGKSLPEEHLESVFDPFFHLERPGKKGRRNRGLAFSRIAAQSQGGDLTAENLREGGVAFRLKLLARPRTTATLERE